MLDLDAATTLAANMEMLIRLGLAPISPYGQTTATTYAVAARLLSGNPEIGQAIQARKSGYGGVDFNATVQARDLGESPCGEGKVFLTKFYPGTRGSESKVTVDMWRGRLNIVLVPARETRWEPALGIPYRVRLTRQISKGRTQVWLCKPVGAGEDELAHEASLIIEDAKSAVWTILQQIDSEAEEILKSLVAAMNLPKISVPEIGPFPEFVKWGPWEGTPKSVDTTDRGYLQSPETRRITGRRTATWEGKTGLYDTEFNSTKDSHEYESPDGGRRTHDGWSTSLHSSHFISGVDVIAARSAAVEKYEQELPIRQREIQAASRAVRDAAEAAVAGVEIPGLPAGHRLDPVAVLRRLVYASVGAE